MSNSKIFIDIETIPTDRSDVMESIKSGLSAPKNYKDPEKINEYIESNHEKEIKKTSLSGLFGKVLCVGYAIDDEQVNVISGNEKEILEESKKIIVNEYGRVEYQIVGHNIINFDFPFLCQRMLINGIKPIYPSGTRKYDMRIFDISDHFSFGARNYFSLHNLCLAFGVKSPKDGIDGSKVFDYYKDGRLDEIYHYCKKDVHAIRELYRYISI